jgi:hypothetical protein
MKYLMTFERFTLTVPMSKGASIEQKHTLMDKDVKKEMTPEEEEKLNDAIEKEMNGGKDAKEENEKKATNDNIH